MIFRKIEQDNCFTIQQIVNERYFAAQDTVVMQRFAILWTNCFNICISQDICYVGITDNKHIQTIYGHRVNLFNNKVKYYLVLKGLTNQGLFRSITRRLENWKRYIKFRTC